MRSAAGVRASTGFSLEDFLADLEDGGMEPQAMPSQCLPARLMAWETNRDCPPLEIKEGLGFAVNGICLAIGELMEVRVLLLEDSGSTLTCQIQSARVWTELKAAYPWIEFKTSLSRYPFLSDAGDVSYWFDPEPQNASALGTRVKKLI